MKFNRFTVVKITKKLLVKTNDITPTCMYG